MAAAISFLLTLARKPSRPKLMPITGVPESRIRVTISSMVPSPPNVKAHRWIYADSRDPLKYHISQHLACRSNNHEAADVRRFQHYTAQVHRILAVCKAILPNH